MIRVTIEGHGSDKVGRDLKYFFQVGQRKVVRHYIVAEAAQVEPIPACDVAIIEIKEVKQHDTGTRG